MKTFRLMSMAVLCMAIALVSCSGEDGKDGLPGEDGADGAQGTQGVAGADGSDGADGINCWDLNGNGVGDAEEDLNDDGNFDALDCQGADGTNGADGNANVVYTDYDITSFSGTVLIQNLDLTDLEINIHAFLYYIKRGNRWYSVPGGLLNNSMYARVYLAEGGGGTLNINFYNTDDNSPYDVLPATYDFLRVVRIQISGLGKNGEESLMAQLKAAGVDTSDYYAVAKYFGLE